MSIPGFVIRNALRNKRRALLSVLSVAVSLFLMITLLVGLRELTVPQEGAGAAARLIVRNRISLGSLLPARQKVTIEKMPEVKAVSPFTWFGGKYKGEESMTFAQFAVDPKVVKDVMEDAKMPAEAWEKFISDRRACIIGRKTADKYKIKEGDRFPLTGTYYPFDLDLFVAGIYSGTPDDRNVFFHHKYLDEMGDGGGQVGTWWVMARSIDEVGPLVEKINKAFENTSAEVRAETERAFALSFVSMWGNIQLLIQSICSVVVFTLALVSASTMSMAIRERFRELAVLKAIGFRRREIFAFILAESFGLSALGGLLGIGGAYSLFTFANISALTNNVFIQMEVTTRIMAQAAVVAVLLGVVAAVAPSIAAARMSVVDGLKTLD